MPSSGLRAAGSEKRMSDVDMALDLLYSLVLEDGRRWGEAARRFQRDDAEAILDHDDGPPFHFMTRGRGGSKSTDLGGMGVAVLAEQAPARSRSYAIASDRDQAGLLHDAAAGLVLRSGLQDVIDVEARRLVNRATDATLEVLPADGPSTWGLRPYFVVVDELAQWQTTRNARTVWDAVVSALGKVPGARCAVLTTAGDPAHWSYAVLKHARASGMWRTSETPGPVPWIPEDHLEEQRGLLLESRFRQLHLNEWVASEDRLVREDDLDAAFVLDGPQEPAKGRAYLICVDVGLKHDRTVVSVTHRAGERVVLDRMETLAGTRQTPVRLQAVEDTIVTAWEQYNRARVLLDPWQAVGLQQRLQARGIRAQEFTFTASSVGRIASALHLALRDRRLDLYEADGLRDELAAVRLRQTSPGVVRLDHDADQHDDRAVTLAMAVHHHTSKPKQLDHAALGRAMVDAAAEMYQESPVGGFHNW